MFIPTLNFPYGVAHMLESPPAGSEASNITNNRRADLARHGRKSERLNVNVNHKLSLSHLPSGVPSLGTLS